ncbi:HAD-IC family P-type ATPase [Nocardia cyriacigeorgica]|uniref:HAD-IC family P-type ATPase n=1 Tax=Nocardia cyriacigeorgica TaxID=135487 RepID=UPI0024544EB2|nr:HAD-IC family P-type ATPase [Nocardia cyriacigeorgica]
MTTSVTETPGPASAPTAKRTVARGVLDPALLLSSLPEALRKLDPRTLWRNPVMLIVEVGAVWSTVLALADPSFFGWAIVVWLWLTVLFANLAEAVAEGRGKAQADTLRKAKTDTVARRLPGWMPGARVTEERIAAPQLRRGDYVVVEAGEVIPGDGDVVEGIASVDESAITGESAPVIRESGGDRCAVSGGTTVLSDRIVVEITQEPGASFIDKMIALVEGASRQKTPNEIALNILLAADGRSLRKGAASAVTDWVRAQGGSVPDEVGAIVDGISASGGTPLVVGELAGGRARLLGVIHLKDVVKHGMRERFDEMRRMGIRTVMITGDNPLTAEAIADEAGVDDFLAEATPEDKLALIKKEQDGGRLVAMTGDGTNDAPALAQADVGVAMNTGTSAAKEAGNMVDLDSDPTKLIEIVEIGKQLLITRGALTTFSISNDIAKYFAIIPALFVSLFPGLDALNVMRLASPQSAILSAVIFNALVIVALIPLALRGVKYRPSNASALLSRNLLVYGLGGIVAPFAGIKLIDLVVHLFPGMS